MGLRAVGVRVEPERIPQWSVVGDERGITNDRDASEPVALPLYQRPLVHVAVTSEAAGDHRSCRPPFLLSCCSQMSET